MSLELPEETARVEDRVKADVQREAPDSNPYIFSHWLRSLIAGIARRIFDFYGDLRRTELRVFADTADDETAPIWGNIFIGSANQATIATGEVIATGTVGATIGIGEVLQVNSLDYVTTSNATIAANSISIDSITRTGSIVTVITSGDHKLSSFVPVSILGAAETEYNVVDASIVVTGLDSFTFSVSGTPTTPATGTITANFDSAAVIVDSIGFGNENNQSLDTPLTTQSPIVNIDDTLYVSFATIGGGADAESLEDYQARYLDKIRNPISQFSISAITAKAKQITGVTRVFVQTAGTEIGTVVISGITRVGQVATATTATPHMFEDGFQTTITGADQTEYNLTKTRILVESATVFHFLVTGSPTTPATTGTSMNAATVIPVGTVRTYFMRDNDADNIPSASEVATVKNAIDEILPANTSSDDNLVLAPTGIPVNYDLTELVPNSSTMREAVTANLQQFHEEQTTVSIDIDQDAYRAAIKNTVDLSTGETVQSFELSTPTTDIAIESGEIGIIGTVTFNIP